MFRKIRKLLSALLVLALVVQLVPSQCFASGTSVLLDTANNDVIINTEDSISHSQVVGEDISRRDEFYKEFVLTGGLRLASVYPEAVHFEKDGLWEEIDNTLVSDGSGGYTNRAGAWSVRFPSLLSASEAISVSRDGHTLSFTMAGALRNDGGVAVASLENQAVTGETALTAATAQLSSARIQAVDFSAMEAELEHPQVLPRKLYSRLSYAEVYAGTTVTYDLSGSRLKESVILSAYDAGLWGYRYTLSAGDLTPVLREDGSIDLQDGAEETVMRLNAPFLIDAAGATSCDVQVHLTQAGTGYTLSYYLPRTWLADPARTWPVVLDPVVQPAGDISNIQDITVAQNPTADCDDTNDPTLTCGYRGGNGAMRVYLRYKTLPTLTASQVVVNATVCLYATSGTSTATGIGVHKVTEAWNSSTTSYTWATAPAFVDSVEDQKNVGSINTAYSWDVTDIVRKWYAEEDGLSSSTGMLFKATSGIENGGVSNNAIFKSSDHSSGSDLPGLTFTFADVSGMEDYWQYSSSSAGRAGTGAVNLYSGNLVWTHSDMGFDGLLMPVSIQHIYNSGASCASVANSSANPFGLGNGWRTNYHQRVWVAAYDDSEVCFVWEDGDGTRHVLFMILRQENTVT